MSAGSIDVWGPALWKFLHASSFAFPVEPEPARQRQMLEFLRCVGLVLPCKTCRDHYVEYVAEHLDERAVRSRSALVEWVVALHNSVNRRTGKREWTVEEARRMHEPRGGGGSCPTAKRARRLVAPMAWFCAVVVLAVLILLAATLVRRIPN